MGLELNQSTDPMQIKHRSLFQLNDNIKFKIIKHSSLRVSKAINQDG